MYIKSLKLGKNKIQESKVGPSIIAPEHSEEDPLKEAKGMLVEMESEKEQLEAKILNTSRFIAKYSDLMKKVNKGRQDAEAKIVHQSCVICKAKVFIDFLSQNDFETASKIIGSHLSAYQHHFWDDGEVDTGHQVGLMVQLL